MKFIKKLLSYLFMFAFRKFACQRGDLGNEMMAAGFMRIGRVLEILPFSRSGWFHGIRVGIYPKPVKLSPRVAAWRNSDILKLAAELGARDKVNNEESNS